MWHPTRKAIHTPHAPAPPPFLSQAILANDKIVYCSGQVGVNPATGELIKGPIQARTKQILTNLQSVLSAAGSSLADVVKVNIFLTDMNDFAAVNEVYKAVFGAACEGVMPARTCVAVKSLPMGTDVEIECSGLVREGHGKRGAKL
ncbi:putative L-PSP endoribonuclease family protein Brt1 [Aspergillus saccharolyticus JOP 1030-1]|uniref:L-PSP endoribonuclease family protein Brt1 n=1 Tax=Aspergillus saccharolyticus JOP 1030-1 TaxID=1450539 RepID=A0A318ZK90_9EURO|nr:L-PSP endoribonuclease family protein Brt1 [Aspergillus saccharolyticus JOP 1030-1]PYH47205.1 L-PSP endoribonuclease family protein Brt1 [Aspergillus saccharolyticus JOP 1030-1]